VQPPVVALAVREIWQRGEDAGFLKEALPSLERHFEWLATTRTIGNSGLVSIFSPWESGQDHKPGFDRFWGVFAKIPLGLYPALYLAEIAMSCRRYDPQQIVKRGWFNVRECFSTRYMRWDWRRWRRYSPLRRPGEGGALPLSAARAWRRRSWRSATIRPPGSIST